jgi:adenylate cyclase
MTDDRLLSERHGSRLGAVADRIGIAARRHPTRRNLAIAVFLAVLLLPLHGRIGVRVVESRLFDILSTLAPPEPARPGAVIVAIDEPSLADIGERWPWSRALHGRLVESLKRAGAAVIALDIVFAEPSSPEADAALASSLDNRTVLAVDRDVIESLHGVQISLVGPLPALTGNGAASGVTSVDLDADGVLRRLPAVDGSFAAAILKAAEGAAFDVPSRSLIQFFGGARTYPTVSYYQALDADNLLPPGIFKDKIALVGLSLKAAPLTDSGAADAFQTPFTLRTGTLTAGVEAHATILDNLRHGLWIVPAPLPVIWIAILLCACLACGSSRTSTSWRTAFQAGAVLAGIVIGAWAVLRFGRFWIPPAVPVLAAASVFATRFALDFGEERRRRAAITAAFSRYVSPELVAELAADPERLRLGGETVDLSILFCDVRGFTGLSEQLKDDPVRLTAMVNRLLDVISERVLANHGTIDKYMGDCVMAFWNAPTRQAEHASLAVATALEILDVVDRVAAELQREAPDLPTFAVGIGINTGLCVVGNIGSRWRYDYSALGDAVNVASRLESATKQYGVPILIGEETARKVGGAYRVIEIDRIAVRGRVQTAPIYTVEKVARPT